MKTKEQFEQLIKFPTITKLAYSGEDQSMLRKTSTTMMATKTKLTIAGMATRIDFPKTKDLHQNTNQKRKFSVVQLPKQNQVMGICTLSLPDKKTLHRKSHSVAVINTNNISDSKNEEVKQENESQKKLNRKISLKSQGSMTDRLLGLKFSVGKKTTRSLSNFTKSKAILEKKVNFNELHSQIILALGLHSGVMVKRDNNFRIKRAKIDPGNNGFLIKQIIKRRSWWNTTKQDPNENVINLIWTEHLIKHKNKFIQSYTDVPMALQKSTQSQNRLTQNKVILPHSFHQVIQFYPKMMQLFFSEEQPKPKLMSQWVSSLRYTRQINAQNLSISNHIPNNCEITEKKMLFKNLTKYYSNSQCKTTIPITYHITAFDWQEVVSEIRQKQKSRGAWLLKPGQNTNRGKGITVFKNKNQGLDYIIKQPPKTEKKSYIFQQYINPLLYEGRKFDIRCFMLGVQIYDRISFYWYEEGYARTASQKFTLKNTSKSIHLTNDAIQKNMQNYDKYESGNKLSYSELEKYLLNNTQFKFTQNILKRMKSIATDICKSSPKLQGNKQKVYFELFGLDFILSEHGIPYILQVNTNPSLEICSNLLSRIIPEVVQNTFRLVLDVLLPSSKGAPDWSQNFILNNKYSLIHKRNLNQEKEERL